jgi:hypothetical protein
METTLDWRAKERCSKWSADWFRLVHEVLDRLDRALLGRDRPAGDDPNVWTGLGDGARHVPFVFLSADVGNREGAARALRGVLAAGAPTQLDFDSGWVAIQAVDRLRPPAAGRVLRALEEAEWMGEM